jgi:hypothetical protein
MSLDKKLKEYVALSSHVAEIISPLKSLGIIGFFYTRVFDNGEILDLTAKPDWAEYYFRKLFASEYPKESMQDHIYIENGVNLWELNPHNPIWQDGKNIFSYCLGVMPLRVMFGLLLRITPHGSSYTA